MKYFYLPIMAVALIFTGCGENRDTHQGQSGNHLETDELQISLNDGQKWKLDDHTRAALKAMTDRIEAGGDPNVVGDGLQSDLEKLIQGCTMTGEDHNKLHTYLEHLIPAVQEASANSSADSVKKVEDLLQEYPQYFE